jgi:hypothetical protein
MTISNFLENELLDTLDGAGSAYSASATYLKLHVGDPGETGANNPATETTRKSVSFNAASGGSKTSTATVEWTLVAATETYTHWSLWDNSTAGNCLWYGALSANAAVTAGDTFEITSLTLTLD